MFREIRTTFVFQDDFSKQFIYRIEIRPDTPFLSGDYFGALEDIVGQNQCVFSTASPIEVAIADVCTKAFSAHLRVHCSCSNLIVDVLSSTDSN